MKQPAAHSRMLYTGMFLAASLSPLGSTMIAVALPSIGAELQVESGILTQWLVSSYLIAGIAMMSPGGKLGDLLGHRKSLVVGMTIYGVGSAGGFIFANLPSLAIARIAQATGGAMTVPATMALLRNVVAPEKRARTFGYFGSVMGTAAAIGPLIGGELTARFGWRSVFIASIPVILAALLLIRLAGLRTVEAPSKTVVRPRFDIEGSVLLGTALTLMVSATQISGAAAGWAFTIGMSLLIAFALWERRVPSPVLDLRLYLNSSFTAGNLVIALQNLAMYALLFQLPIFFEQVRGIEAGLTGRTIIGMMIAMVLTAPLGGRLSERFGARLIVFTGSICCLAGIALVGNFESMQAPGDALAGLILLGVGLGFSSAPSQAAAMSSVGHDKAGMAGGAVSTARYIGGVIGVAALGFLLDRDSGIASHASAVFVYGAAVAAAASAALILPRKISEVRGP